MEPISTGLAALSAVLVFLQFPVLLRGWQTVMAPQGPLTRRIGYAVIAGAALCLVANIREVYDLALHVQPLSLEGTGLVLHVVEHIGYLTVTIGLLWMFPRTRREVAELEESLVVVLDGLPDTMTKLSILENEDLTDREREICEVIATGMTSNNDIAATLSIAPSTAATHVRNILGKLEVRNRNELMLATLYDQLRDEGRVGPRS